VLEFIPHVRAARAEEYAMRALMRSVTPGGVALPVLALAIDTDYDSGYNIATAAGIAVATRIVLTINPSHRVKVLTSGVLPAGSELRLINKGVSFGPGGAGGNFNSNGSNGGHAIVLTASCGLVQFEIENGNGYILGGGGGGKGSPGSNGAGGGGGAGLGAGGTGAGGFYGGPGEAGRAPTFNGASWAYLDHAGGAGGYPGLLGGSVFGNGGTSWGATGVSGDGSPGKAIALNGGVTPTWISGNTAERVKGAVS
jgi:hypothetical protein